MVIIDIVHLSGFVPPEMILNDREIARPQCRETSVTVKIIKKNRTVHAKHDTKRTAKRLRGGDFTLFSRPHRLQRQTSHQQSSSGATHWSVHLYYFGTVSLHFCPWSLVVWFHPLSTLLPAVLYRTGSFGLLISDSQWSTKEQRCSRRRDALQNAELSTRSIPALCPSGLNFPAER